ncbi:hypothetical protein BGZ72_006448 [Mortierella alpina]|nr:hypothetical protein BGZ72_006448 [Mortierella alpina]
MQARKTYMLVATVFFMVVFLSHRRSRDSSHYTGPSQVPSPKQREPYKAPSGNDPDPHWGPPIAPLENIKAKPPPVVAPPQQPSSASPPPLPLPPNTSNQYDTLVVIPSSWNQFQSRRWVRDTIFGIKDNLEPCQKYTGRIIYKFYIHGRSTWLRSGTHSAQFMQAQVRDLHAEFMEFNDWTFTNTTVAVAERHDIWDNALAWAVNTFIPQEKVQVDKIVIFDSTTVVNLPKVEQSAKEYGNTGGFVATWGEATTDAFAAMVSLPVLENILKNRAAIKANHKMLDVLSAAMLYYTNPAPAYKVVKNTGHLWESAIDQIPATATVVGQVYQLEDWAPLAAKMAIQPTAACAVDQNRKKNIAILTSSYIYADMCMAEASLPAAENKRVYADKHGYDYVARSTEFAQEEFRHRRLVWGKIGAIQKTLPHYEWLLWMDMDAVLANFDKDAREIIKLAEESSGIDGREISLIVSRPKKDKMVNAGVMLIKNTDWSKRFWSEVQRRKDWYNKPPSFEQGAIWDVMQDPAWSSGVHLFDRDDHTMNTFPRYYEEGDFVIHFAPASCPAVQVLEALNKIKTGQSALGVGVEKRTSAATGTNKPTKDA